MHAFPTVSFSKFNYRLHYSSLYLNDLFLVGDCGKHSFAIASCCLLALLCIKTAVSHIDILIILLWVLQRYLATCWLRAVASTNQAQDQEIVRPPISHKMPNCCFHVPVCTLINMRQVTCQLAAIRKLISSRNAPFFNKNTI